MSDDDLIRRQYPVPKPHEIERIIWEAMGWTFRHAGTLIACGEKEIPAYDEAGTSNAEEMARRCAARIISSIDAASADDSRAEGFAAGWAAAIEAAAGALHNAANDCRSTGNELPARKIEDEIPLVRAIPMPTDAVAALDRLTAKARAQGMREAAEMLDNPKIWANVRPRSRLISDILDRAEEIKEEARNG